MWRRNHCRVLMQGAHARGQGAACCEGQGPWQEWLDDLHGVGPQHTCQGRQAIPCPFMHLMHGVSQEAPTYLTSACCLSTPVFPDPTLSEPKMLSPPCPYTFNALLMHLQRAPPCPRVGPRRTLCEWAFHCHTKASTQRCLLESFEVRSRSRDSVPEMDASYRELKSKCTTNSIHSRKCNLLKGLPTFANTSKANSHCQPFWKIVDGDGGHQQQHTAATVGSSSGIFLHWGVFGSAPFPAADIPRGGTPTNHLSFNHFLRFGSHDCGDVGISSQEYVCELHTDGTDEEAPCSRHPCPLPIGPVEFVLLSEFDGRSEQGPELSPGHPASRDENKGYQDRVGQGPQEPERGSDHHASSESEHGVENHLFAWPR